VKIRKRYYLIIIIITILFLFFLFDRYGKRSDVEMFSVANNLYEVYIFEFAIDSGLFPSLTIENRQDDSKCYRWIAKGTEDDPVGIQIIVDREKGSEPKMTSIGWEKWDELVGSKYNKPNWKK